MRKTGIKCSDPFLEHSDPSRRLRKVLGAEVRQDLTVYLNCPTLLLSGAECILLGAEDRIGEIPIEVIRTELRHP